MGPAVELLCSAVARNRTAVEVAGPVRTGLATAVAAAVVLCTCECRWGVGCELQAHQHTSAGVLDLAVCA